MLGDLLFDDEIMGELGFLGTVVCMMIPSQKS
jgi:hypothetical protein